MPEFASEWARCAPWLQASLDGDPQMYTLDDVLARVMERSARFWAGRNAAMVTEITERPRAKVFNFWLAGGELAELRDELAPAGEAYARELGCDYTAVAGRPGWARVLGYRPIYTVCMKGLT